MKSLIAFLLGYLAANWVASHGGIQKAISSVQTPSTTQTPSVLPTNRVPANTYTPYTATFRIQ